MTHIGGIKSLNSCFITGPSDQGNCVRDTEAENLRDLDVFERLILSKNPILPSLITVLHGPKYDFGHLETRISQPR